MKPHPIAPGPFSVLRHTDFRNYLLSRFFSVIAVMMVSVAVGWQVYAMTQDPLMLGYVGLVQFVPAMVLTLPGGLAADRFDRKRVLLFGIGMEVLVAGLLLAVTLEGQPSVFWILSIVTLLGVGRAFLAPASQSLVPSLVPREILPRAVAWSSSTFQGASIAGPAVGGLLYAVNPELVYGVSLTLLAAAALLVLMLRVKLPVRNGGSYGFEALFSGVRFLFQNRILLGAASLDLFAVLLGGATALLPIFAGEILQTGPWGLGLLRSAPALGAAGMALWLTQHPIRGKVGAKLYFCVALFGVATIAFGLSRSFVLSLLLLFFMGAVDMVSVVIRHTLLQLSTPDDMRGRVSSVNMLFIGASNELGEFESGLTAAWLGTVPAVVVGGLGTIAMVALWTWCFPELRKLDRLESQT